MLFQIIKFAKIVSDSDRDNNNDLNRCVEWSAYGDTFQISCNECDSISNAGDMHLWLLMAIELITQYGDKFYALR